MYAIGEKIKYYRKQRKMTQKELSEKLGISNSMLSNYESGSSAPTTDFVFRTIEALELSDDEKFDLLGLSDVVDRYKRSLGIDKVSTDVYAYSDLFRFNNAKDFKSFEIAVLDTGLEDYVDVVGILNNKTNFSDFNKDVISASYNQAVKLIKSLGEKGKSEFLEFYKNNYMISEEDVERISVFDVDKSVDNISEKVLQELENQVNSND